MPPFPARSRSGSPLALCKSLGGDATDRGTHRVVRSVENRSSRASVLINCDELAEISLLLGIYDVEAAMSWKTVSSDEWRKMAGKIGAWSAWAQDRWRAQNGDARKETGRIDGEGREAIEEGDEGAIEGNGRMTRRKVSIGGTKKKERKKKRKGKEGKEGKKLKPPLESNRFLGQGCREWKSKSASLDGRVIVLVFSLFFPLSHEWNSIVLNSVQVYVYPWPTIVDIVIAISIYRWSLFDCIE